MRTRSAIVLLAPALALAGCATSPWKSGYEPEPGAPSLAPIPADVVVVRPAPFERVDDALREFERAWADSDVYWEDWPEDERRFHTDNLISALQLPGTGDHWDLLGRSRFTSYNPLDPEDGDLRDLAADLGADHAIWTSYYVGKTERVVDRPVHYPSWHYSHGRRGRGGFGGGTTTVWVPVTVKADETLWMAFFLRRR